MKLRENEPEQIGLVPAHTSVVMPDNAISFLGCGNACQK